MLLDGAMIAMFLGVLGSSVVHLSQGMMKLGLTRMRETAVPRSGRWIYATGILMNFSAPFWVILANTFAPTVFYTSMYGMGLIALVVFSCVKMGECLRPIQLWGTASIIGGTLFIGAGEMMEGTPTMADWSLFPVAVFAALWLVSGPLIALWWKGQGRSGREVFLGLAAGGMLALDAVFKGIAQAGDDGSTFLPQGSSWWIFGASFLGAVGAFGMLQWAYVRKCRVAVVVPSYDVAYVAVPLLVVPLAVEDAAIGWWCVVGLALLALGVYGIQSGPVQDSEKLEPPVSQV